MTAVERAESGHLHEIHADSHQDPRGPACSILRNFCSQGGGGRGLIEWSGFVVHADFLSVCLLEEDSVKDGCMSPKFWA